MSNPQNPLTVWLKQTRANFLVLAVLLVLVGVAAARLEGPVSWGRALLTMLGVVLAHAAVNLFNELSDFRTGIDQRTRRTPFSGGSGTLQAGHTTPRAVAAAAVATTIGAGLIGLYLSWVAGWLLLAPAALGFVVSITYTQHLSRWALGELAAGLCLGSLVVLGAFYALTSTITLPVVILSIPPGLLTAELLFLNEFPDLEADREGGRRHLVIRLGRRRAAVLYSAVLAATYLVIAAGVVAGQLPAWALLGLATVPLAVKAAATALRTPESFERMVGALGANVLVVLGTDLLLAAGLFVAAL